MIKIKHLELYKKYRGNSDAIYLVGTNEEVKEFTDDEIWFLIQNLLQDIFLVKKELVAQSFSKKLNQKIDDNCENLKTKEELLKLTEYIYSNNLYN